MNNLEGCSSWDPYSSLFLIFSAQRGRELVKKLQTGFFRVVYPFEHLLKLNGKKFHCVAEVDISDFMASFRRLCPEESVFPKLHYLEDHLVSFIRKWHVGPGMIGEHGGESIHHLFNKLAERYSSMPHAHSRLKHTLRQHLQSVNPNLPDAPTRKRRK